MFNIFRLITWVTITTPKNILRTMFRILQMINNQMSFTLNIKLLFTPLFGDYTIVGRFTGFIFRIMNILIGTIVLCVLCGATIVLPLFWYVVPLILLEKELIVLPLYALAIVGIWYLNTKNTPIHRIKDTKGNRITSFRPEVIPYLNSSKIKVDELITKISKTKNIEQVLSRTELLNTDFIQKITKTDIVEKETLIRDSFENAKTLGNRYVEVEHIFLSIVQKTEKIETILSTYNSNVEVIAETIKWVVRLREIKDELFLWQDDYQMPPAGGTGRGMTGRVTPALDSISEDYTKQVKYGLIKPVVGREEEIKKLAELLTEEGANLLLIGDPGSGKTSIIKGIAYNIIVGTKHKSLNNKRVISLNIGKLLAGTKSSGEVAAKLTVAMEEIQGSRDIILFVDEMHELLKGDNNLASVYSILEPYIHSPDVRFIGATSIQDYRRYIEPIGAFARLFQILEIKEASEKDTLDILKIQAEDLEPKHSVLITYPALRACIKLSEKLVHERVLPDKAIVILHGAVAKNDGRIITTDIIAKEISDYTHVPVESINTDEAKKLLGMYEAMQKMVIGQNEALKQVSEALKRARVGIRNENKPIASFLFIGTTGVGKTQTAKALAKNFFGSKDTMIRLDMSEYQQLDSMNRLLGTPDGKMKGLLTDAVRTKPFSLVLLDEIEKAHQNILLTFLQVLDDGRLTDATGTTADFTNSIIIATSNVGTREIQDVFNKGGDFEQMKQQALVKVREKFAPEFLNRFNDIIVFHPLNMENIDKIAKLLLEDVKVLTKDKGIELTFKPELVKEIVKRGYSPEWGARPLAREIENVVENYLANKILKNEIKSGDIVELGTEICQ